MCTYRVVFPQAHRARTSSYSSYVPNPPKGCQSLGTRTFPILTSSEAEGADRFGMSTCQKRLYSVSPHNSRQLALGTWYLVVMYRGNGGIRRGIYQLQGDANGHVGRPREVSPARPCPELLCELRGLCRRSYPGPRTCGRSEKPMSSGFRGLNPGFQRNLSPP